MSRDVCFSQRLLCLWTLALLISSHICFVSSRLSEEVSTIASLPTVTVRGFLNFKTTVDGTVIVFTPASDVQATKPTDPPQFSTNAILHSNALDSKDGVENIQDLAYSEPTGLDLIKPRSDLDHQAHRAKESFQHISDNAVLPSTVQTNNDLETDAKKDISPLHQYPTGLVTVLGGTHIEKGSTTVFETKVIGTYIDGKYAQILQSTSKIIAPTSVLSPQKEEVMTLFNKNSGPKTTTPIIEHTTTTNEVLPLPSPSISPSSPSSSYVATTTETSAVVQITSSLLETSKSDEVTSTFEERKELPVTKTVEQISVTSRNLIQSSFKTPEFTPSFKQIRPTQNLESAKTSILTKTSRFQPVATIKRPPPFEEENTVASPPNRNSRTSSSRIRFVAPRRPSQTVRLNRFKVKLTVRQDSSDDFELTTIPEDEQPEEDTTREQIEEDHPQEVTPIDVDPAQVVFQETTITSEVTLHVGRRKSVRTLTITTSVPLKVDPTDVELLLHTTDSPNFQISEDHEDEEIPDPSVVTRTFTTTERTLKTSLLPIFDGHVTSYHTVTESFFIMKIITAYRTLPPGDVTVLEDLDEAVVDMTPTLEVAANIQSSVVTPAPPQKEQKQATGQTSPEAETQIQSSAPFPEATQGNINTQLSNPLLSLGAALSNNPLAAVYLGLQQLNAQMTLYSTFTEVSTYVTTDTIYHTKTIRFYDGRSTRFRTISDPLSTKKRTVTTTMTSVQPYINTQALQQQQQLQKLIAATQLSPPRPQMSTVTSVYTTVTTATSLSTRIYTLIYNGFSTKFRTVTSSTLYPTTVTVTSTKEIPISPTTPPSVPFAYPYPA